VIEVEVAVAVEAVVPVRVLLENLARPVGAGLVVDFFAVVNAEGRVRLAGDGGEASAAKTRYGVVAVMGEVCAVAAGRLSAAGFLRGRTA
jgi:hypothetical protein